MISIGYDVGSSSIKASLYDTSSGKALAQSTSPQTEMRIDSPHPGWAEQDPEGWWANVKAATSELFSKARVDKKDVKAIGISYQMHGLVVVDEGLHVLRPSIIWCDSRAVGIGESAFREIGEEKCLKALLNSPGNFTASKLKWVIENEPAVFKRVYKFMLPGDFIAMKLSGEITTSATGLSEGILWNFADDRPADFVMEHFGFDSNLVPRIVDSFGVQCTVSKKAAAEIGLQEGTPVTYRAGDQPNNAFSLNVLEPGEIASTAGTSGVVYGVSEKVLFDNRSRVNTFAHVNHKKDRKRLGILLCINGTGISYGWIRRMLFDGPVAYEQLNAIADQSEIGSRGLTFLPFGNGAERMLSNMNPFSQFSGIDFNTHTRGNILRSVLEGVAFSFYYGIKILGELGVEPRIIRAGMANMYLNKTFRTAVATLSGAEIQLYNTDGSLGAARAAAYGAGGYSNLNEAFKELKCIETVQPDRLNYDGYRSAYENWEKQLVLITKQLEKRI